mmetsp:Transcript_38264/g.58340  ORF Transcript_38264/g.58340 Transcript_38264/m.58340 type:complete len:92 (+) Transcript_38264:565-840(+)
MRERTLDYKDPWKQFRKKVLEQIHYFPSVAKDFPFFLDEVQYHLKEEVFEKGTEIIGPDCPLQHMIFVVQGLVDLFVFDPDGHEIELDTLG